MNTISSTLGTQAKAVMPPHAGRPTPTSEVALTVAQQIAEMSSTLDGRLTQLLARLRGPVPQEVGGKPDTTPRHGGLFGALDAALTETAAHVSQSHRLLDEIETFI